MKLRNKKTGDIVEFETTIYADTEDRTYEFNSIAELNEEWEDYQEPNWYINVTGEVLQNNKGYCNVITPEKLKAIGNYFETKEEAEKAVEKLKAWQRLKDKGFNLEGIVEPFFCLDIYMAGNSPRYQELKKDLIIVFGGNNENTRS